LLDFFAKFYYHKPMSQKKVLVVDDEDFIRDLVKDFLDLDGILCDEASDLASAIKLLNSQNYDTILLDRNLGSYKADTIIKELRRLKDKIPIVILTGDHLCDDEYISNIGESF